MTIASGKRLWQSRWRSDPESKTRVLNSLLVLSCRGTTLETRDPLWDASGVYVEALASMGTWTGKLDVHTMIHRVCDRTSSRPSSEWTSRLSLGLAVGYLKHQNVGVPLLEYRKVDLNILFNRRGGSFPPKGKPWGKYAEWSPVGCSKRVTKCRNESNMICEHHCTSPYATTSGFCCHIESNRFLPK